MDTVGHLEMVYVLEHCQLVITDRRGKYKGAFFNKSCITLRNETEQMELVSYGCNTLVGIKKSKIFDTFHKKVVLKINPSKLNFYDNASKLIVENLMNLQFLIYLFKYFNKNNFIF